MRVIGLTVAVIGWLYILGPFRRPAIRRRLRGRQIGIRAFGADTFGDSRRVPPPLRNVRAIGVSVAEGASARATTWKKASRWDCQPYHLYLHYEGCL